MWLNENHHVMRNDTKEIRNAAKPTNGAIMMKSQQKWYVDEWIYYSITVLPIRFP